MILNPEIAEFLRDIERATGDVISLQSGPMNEPKIVINPRQASLVNKMTRRQFGVDLITYGKQIGIQILIEPVEKPMSGITAIAFEGEQTKAARVEAGHIETAVGLLIMQIKGLEEQRDALTKTLDSLKKLPWDYSRPWNVGDIEVIEQALEIRETFTVSPPIAAAPPAAEAGELAAAREILKCYQDAEPDQIFTVPVPEPHSFAAQMEAEIRRYCRHFKEQAERAGIRGDQAVKAAIAMRPALERDPRNGGYTAKLFPGEPDQILRYGQTPTEAVLEITIAMGKQQTLTDRQLEVLREIR